MRNTLKLAMIIALSMINASFCVASFLDWDDDLNLFKKIDTWVYELQTRLTEVAAKWNDPKWDIGKQLNSYLTEKCFKENWSINIKQLNKIASLTWSVYDEKWWNWKNTYNVSNSIDTTTKWWQLEELINILEDECFNKWISVEKLVLYINTIEKHLANSNEKWQENAKAAYSISRIWLYSDWIEENSPFDLMKDLKDINRIIFTEDIPYDWINSMNNDLALNAFLNWKKWQDIINAAKNPSLNTGNNWTWTSNNDSNINPILWDNNDSSYACISNESGLSQKQLDSLSPTWWTWVSLDKIDKVWVNSKFDPNSGWNFSGNKNVSGNAYSPLNDNSLWPCNEFFCITIDFKMYTQNLLWGGKTNSIQALIERSNWHLKKFTNSSLIQARMTTNNFQIWLKDLNLPDLFNVNFIIDKKAPPILNLNWWKELNEKPNEPKISKDLINEYFKNYWLEYDRINDLDIFNKKECEIASVINSAEEQITKSPIKNTACENMEYKNKLNEIIRKNIDSNIVSDDLKDFDNQFVELSAFLANFPQYASEVKIIVAKMLNKPSWSN